jgi:hypothetical protein
LGCIASAFAEVALRAAIGVGLLATALLLSQAASRSACDHALQFKRGSFGSLSVIGCL